jgi:hypothetical protein
MLIAYETETLWVSPDSIGGIPPVPEKAPWRSG